MNFSKKVTIFFFYLLTFSFLFWSCESNFNEVQKSNYSEFVPNGIAEKLNVKYTDSGRISAILITQKMIEYSSVAFPFTDFPKGIKVVLYDKNKKRTVILSDFATSYKITNIIDLKGHVTITSQDGQVLETDQLYFDQKNEWFFTEEKFKFTDTKGVSFGKGIDFSKDFKIINSQMVHGEIESEE